MYLNSSSSFRAELNAPTASTAGHANLQQRSSGGNHAPADGLTVRNPSGTSMNTPHTNLVRAQIELQTPESRAARNKETAERVRDLARERKVGVSEAIDLYLFTEADNLLLGVAATQTTADKQAARQEIISLLALHHPRRKWLVA